MNKLTYKLLGWANQHYVFAVFLEPAIIYFTLIFALIAVQEICGLAFLSKEVCLGVLPFYVVYEAGLYVLDGLYIEEYRRVHREVKKK